MRSFCTGFVAGAAWLQWQGALPEGRAWPLAIAALAAMPLVRGNRLLVVAALLLSGALAGEEWAALRARDRLGDSLPLVWEGRDIELVGAIASLPTSSERGTRFLLDVESVATPQAQVPGTISLAWYPERLAGAPGIAPPALVAGERWRLTVRLKRPHGLANPHTFDFEAWALERGIRATGYVRTKPVAERLATPAPDFLYAVHRLRGEIRDRMVAALPEGELRGVLVALVVGDQDAISQEQWRVFWRTGTGHLVSISGLHVTMLASLAFLVAAFLWVRIPGLTLRVPARKAASVFGLLAALAYTLLAGYSVPTQRTLLMLAAVTAAILAGRHTSATRVLAFAALAVTVLDPWAALSPGFWLSFGAVAAILYAASLRTGRPAALPAALVTQAAVTLVMMPMLLAQFGEVSVVSPLANAFAIPLVSWGVVPPAIAGGLLDSALLLQLSHWLMAAGMSALEWIASWPGAVWGSHAPAGWTVACGMAGTLWMMAPRGVPMRACAVLWLLPLALVRPPGPAAGEAWLDLLDVGHGLAVVVRTAHHALAYDAGPSWSDDSDSGNRIVAPFLRGEGVARLDGVIVTHADDDHAGGAASLILARDAGWLLSSLPPGHELHEAAAISRLCGAGQHWEWDGVRFEILHPAIDSYDRRGVRGNDRSCVLKVSTAFAAALLTGDIERRAEAELVAREAGRLRAEVLLIPHHGSKSSSTPSFIAEVAPRVGLLAVGYRDRFRHPNPEVVARYEAQGIRLARTDESGAIRVRLPAGEDEFELTAYRESSLRYWRDRPPEAPGGGLVRR
jgi:competence protein ComEC